MNLRVDSPVANGFQAVNIVDRLDCGNGLGIRFWKPLSARENDQSSRLENATFSDNSFIRRGLMHIRSPAKREEITSSG
jgi:hypothetical protein